MGLLGRIFGTGDVIKSGIELIDDIHTSDEEEIVAKANAKVSLLQAYEPFKLSQRYLAIMFTFIFIFIMMNGVLGALYGIVEMKNVEDARKFASEMWLGEIMLAIVGFYFGGGFADSIKRNKKEAK